MAERKILFVTYGGGHVDIVARLYGPLADQLGIQVSVLALTTAGSRLEWEGYPFKRCGDFLPAPGYENWREVGDPLSREIWDSSSGVPRDESVAYLGVSMIDLIAELGPKEAQKAYREQGRSAFCPVRFLGYVLAAVQPDVVVTTCNVRMERAAVIAAKSSGVASVLIEDLFGYSMLGEGPVDAVHRLAPREEWPDRIVVMNDAVRGRHLHAGFEPWRVLALGQPAYSVWLEELAACDLAGICRELLDNERPVVTYLAPANRVILYDQVPHLLDVADTHPEWQFAIKLHPSIGEEEFRQNVSNLPPSIPILQSESISQVVKMSDVAVTYQSTSGFLALAAGVPLVVLNCTGVPDAVPYVSQGAAIGVYRYDDLEEGIASAMRIKEVGLPQAPLFEILPDAAESIVHMLVSPLTEDSTAENPPRPE